MTPTCILFRIESCEDGRWSERGRVYLPDQAPPHQIEEALSSVGVYAPRGADTVSWSERRGMVLDAGGYALARLTPIARGAYASVEDAIRPWLDRRRRDPRAAHCSIWLAPGGGFFLTGARLGPPPEGGSDLRGSRRVYRLRRLRRGAPVEVFDARAPGATWTVLENGGRS